MRSGTLLLLFIIICSSNAFSQTERANWTSEYGLSKSISYPNLKGINLRFISPSFQITTEDHHWTEEEQKHPEKFKKVRMMVEFFYAPPFELPTEKKTDVSKIFIPGLFRLVNVKVKTDSSFYYVSNKTKLSEFSAALNFQYKFWEYKRLSLQGTTGLTFFFLTSPGKGLINFNKLFYLNLGLLAQLNLGMFMPFADIGFDRIYTIGTEVKLRSIFRKAGKRYKLHLENK